MGFASLNPSYTDAPRCVGWVERSETITPRRYTWRLDSVGTDGGKWRATEAGELSQGGPRGTNGAMPLRGAQGDRLRRAGAGLSLPLQGVPAPHRHRLPLRHGLAKASGADRGRTQDL